MYLPTGTPVLTLTVEQRPDKTMQAGMLLGGNCPISVGMSIEMVACAVAAVSKLRNVVRADIIELGIMTADEFDKEVADYAKNFEMNETLPTGSSVKVRT